MAPNRRLVLGGPAFVTRLIDDWLVISGSLGCRNSILITCSSNTHLSAISIPKEYYIGIENRPTLVHKFLEILAIETVDGDMVFARPVAVTLGVVGEVSVVGLLESRAVVARVRTTSGVLVVVGGGLGRRRAVALGRGSARTPSSCRW